MALHFLCVCDCERALYGLTIFKYVYTSVCIYAREARQARASLYDLSWHIRQALWLWLWFARASRSTDTAAFGCCRCRPEHKTLANASAD